MTQSPFPKLLAQVLSHVIGPAGNDEEGMFMPVEIVSVDDAIWFRVHDFSTGDDRWVMTFGGGPGGWIVVDVSDEELAECELDEWRI